VKVTVERLRRLSKAAKEAKELADDAREARDRAIAQADDEGWGLREIARAIEMSVSHTQRVVVDATARRQTDDALPGVD
jgi:hypothetical protein